jgi:hypothetical protein
VLLIYRWLRSISRFRFQEFQLSTLAPPQYFHPKSTIYRCVSLTDRQLWLTSSLRDSRVSNLNYLFLPECFHLKIMIYQCISLTDRWLWFTLALRSSRVSNLEHSLSPREISAGVHEYLSCVLMNQKTTILFGYSGFGDLKFYTPTSS